VVESLEERAVPSHLGLRGLLFGGRTPTVQAQDARQVQQAFNAFTNTFNREYRAVLYGADANGNINPAANRNTFNQDINAALGALNTNASGAVGNLVTSTSNATLPASISASLVGTDANSLQAQLVNLTTPSGAFTTSARTFQRQAHAAINAVENQVLQSIRGATTPSTTSGGTTTTTTTASAVSQALPQVRQAFATFQSSYTSDVQNILYKADTTGSINPSNNRVAFDAQVGTDLATLQSNLHTALSNIPNNTTLLSQVDAAITGTDANGLQTQLKNLATPSGGAYSLSARLFNVGSNLAISGAQRGVTSLIANSAGLSTSGRGGFLSFLHRLF